MCTFGGAEDDWAGLVGASLRWIAFTFGSGSALFLSEPELASAIHQKQIYIKAKDKKKMQSKSTLDLIPNSLCGFGEYPKSGTCKEQDFQTKKRNFQCLYRKIIIIIIIITQKSFFHLMMTSSGNFLRGRVSFCCHHYKFSSISRKIRIFQKEIKFWRNRRLYPLGQRTCALERDSTSPTHLQDLSISWNKKQTEASVFPFLSQLSVCFPPFPAVS